jgi:hypothetical protein
MLKKYTWYLTNFIEKKFNFTVHLKIQCSENLKVL